MRPVLFTLDLGGHTFGLSTYGVLVAIGSAVAITLAVRQGRRMGMSPNDVLDLSFWMLIAGLAGSRVLYVLINAGDFGRLCMDGRGEVARTIGVAVRDCTAALRIWEGGLVFYGGGLASAAVAAVMARRRGWSFARVADLFAPPLVLGQAIGRLGCFAAGCCFGKTCAPSGWAAAIGARFPPGSVAFVDLDRHGLVKPGAAATLPLHPTQLYEAAGDLIIFFLLLLLRRRQRAFGTLALVYALAYALLRSLVEVFRGDTGRRFVVEIATPRAAALLDLPPHEALWLSTSQALSLVVAAGALTLLVFAARARRRSDPVS
jgi:phosphatidylglycerol:prolipoprotein diacylglycerol transferase